MGRRGLGVIGKSITAATILRAADGRTAERTKTGSNGGSFEASPALIADDATHSGAAEAADDSASLGARAGAGGSEQCGGGDGGEDDVFHSVFSGAVSSQTSAFLFTKK